MVSAAEAGREVVVCWLSCQQLPGDQMLKLNSFARNNYLPGTTPPPPIIPSPSLLSPLHPMVSVPSNHKTETDCIRSHCSPFSLLFLLFSFFSLPPSLRCLSIVIHL